MNDIWRILRTAFKRSDYFGPNAGRTQYNFEIMFARLYVIGAAGILALLGGVLYTGIKVICERPG